jgi:hypothetical protein
VVVVVAAAARVLPASGRRCQRRLAGRPVITSTGHWQGGTDRNHANANRTTAATYDMVAVRQPVRVPSLERTPP